MPSSSKTHRIELAKVSAMYMNAGTVEAQITARVEVAATQDGKTQTSWLMMSPETARTLHALLGSILDGPPP
jgi:hypothetical protein